MAAGVRVRADRGALATSACGHPGFWQRAEARRALRDRLVAVAAAAGSLYGALLGLGVWLVGAPAPFGSRPVFVALSLLLAAALVPLWLRELRSDAS